MIAVLGINGSGTSAIVGLLQDLGVEFAGPYGNCVDWDDGETWESGPALVTNNRLMDKFDGHTPRGPLRLEQIPTYEAMQAVSPMEVDFFPRDLNWKDPKGCITLPVWRYKVRTVVWVRRDHGHIVANLCRHHSGFSEEDIREIIGIYEDRVRQAVSDYGFHCIPVRYEMLYRDRDAVVAAALAEFCGATPSHDTVTAALDRLRQPRNGGIHDDGQDGTDRMAGCNARGVHRTTRVGPPVQAG